MLNFRPSELLHGTMLNFRPSELLHGTMLNFRPSELWFHKHSFGKQICKPTYPMNLHTKYCIISNASSGEEIFKD
jgi:hypothetical protein